MKTDQVKTQTDDVLSPINSQLEVRDADVVLSAIELNLGLKTGERERWMEEEEGRGAGSDPGNPSNAMEKPNGLEEMDVYRSLHTNSCFNKRIREGTTYTYPPHVQQQLRFRVSWRKVTCASHVEKMEINGSTPRRGLWKQKCDRLCYCGKGSFVLQSCTTGVLNHPASDLDWFFFPAFRSLCHPFPSLVAPWCHSCHTLISPNIWETLDPERMLERESTWQWLDVSECGAAALAAEVS